MRVLLRNKKTGVYCCDGEQPGGEPNEARDFVTIRAAAEFALAQSWREMEIVLSYDTLKSEIRLPVLPQWCQVYRDPRLQTGAG
jgi:hypothetical protein